MEIVFEDLENIVNSPTGEGSFKIEVEGKNITEVGDCDFIGLYVLTDMKDLAKALVKLKRGLDEVTVDLNGSNFSIDLECIHDQKVRITIRSRIEQDEFPGKNSNEAIVDLDEFCKEIIQVIGKMEETREPEQDDYPARWKGLGEPLKEFRDELKALLKE